MKEQYSSAYVLYESLEKIHKNITFLAENCVLPIKMNLFKINNDHILPRKKLESMNIIK